MSPLVRTVPKAEKYYNNCSAWHGKSRTLEFDGVLQQLAIRKPGAKLIDSPGVDF